MNSRAKALGGVFALVVSAGVATMSLGGAGSPTTHRASPVPALTTTTTSSTVAPSITTMPTTTMPTTTTTSTTLPPTTTTVPSGPWQPVAQVPGLSQLTTPTGTVVRIDPHTFELALVPGTAEPGGAFPEGGAVPAARRASLVMAMNAGFKRRDARAGELVDGRTVGTLIPGTASLVVRTDGTIDVGAWGVTVGPRPDNAVVLQNLTLLVDHGQPAADLSQNIAQRWGFPFKPVRSGAVWRSAAGVDDHGRLLWAVGPNLAPAQLAGLLVAAGAVRAMELDINGVVFAALFVHPDPQRPELLQGSSLMAGMFPTPNHVLTPGPRDFLSVYRRPG